MGRCAVSVLSYLLTWLSSKVLARFLCTVYVVINIRWKKELLFQVWRRVTLEARRRRHGFHSEVLKRSCANLSDYFYDRMTVRRNRFLVNKTNRCTEFQFYWYYDSTCFGQPFCPSSGVLSKRSHNCIKCTKADVRLRTPDDGQKGCPKHAES